MPSNPTSCDVIRDDISLPIAGATKTNSKAITAAVRACLMEIGVIFDNNFDEIIVASDIVTMIREVVRASFIVSGPPDAPFIFATLSKAKATNTIPIPNAITDIILTLPTNLKAIPMANTATAINRIVASPFFRAPVFFGSPASVIGSLGSPVFFSVSFFFAKAISVFWFFRIS